MISDFLNKIPVVFKTLLFGNLFQCFLKPAIFHPLILKLVILKALSSDSQNHFYSKSNSFQSCGKKLFENPEINPLIHRIESSQPNYHYQNHKILLKH
jgi:hypothetical protein